jgi:hypothetical protein
VLKGTQNFNISTATGTEIRADLHDAFMRWLHDFQEAAPLFVPQSMTFGGASSSPI